MHDIHAAQKPTIDDVLKKLDALGKIGEHKSPTTIENDVVPSASRDEILESSQADENTNEDKENCRDDAPNATSMSFKKPHLLGMAEQRKETDKLRTFSIQLQLMHQKGRRNPAPMPNVSLDPTSLNESATLGNVKGSIDASATTYRDSNCRLSVGKSTSSEESQHEELVRQALRMAGASTKIQSVFRGHMVRSEKRAAAFKIVQATKIACAWRGFVARRILKTKKEELAKQQLRMKLAVAIQTRWRAKIAITSFHQARSKIIHLQSSIRMWFAMKRVTILTREVSLTLKRYYSELGCERIMMADVMLCHPMARLEQQLKAVAVLQSKWGIFAVNKCEIKTKEQQILEATSATTIASVWKKFHYQAAFKRALRDVIICQSIARRNSESRKVEKLWNDHRSECAAILIQANWRAFSVAKEYKCIISKVVTIQSTVRMWLAAKRWKVLRQEILSAFARFQSQGRYTLTAKDVAVCQAVVQSISIEKLKSTASKDSTSSTTPSTSTDCTPSTKTNDTVTTSNEISILCNHIMTDPESATASHDFAMIYMSMMSPESEVEAIYLNSGSSDE